MKIGLFVPCYKIENYLARVVSHLDFDADVCIIGKDFKDTSETDVRNEGIKKLAHCDYVFTLDGDEFITKKDQHEIIRQMQETKSDACLIPVINYTKDMEHRIKMTDHAPVVCVDPKVVEFCDGRCLNFKKGLYPEMYLHHFGFTFDEETTQWKKDNYWNTKNPNEYSEKLEEPVEPFEMPNEIKEKIEEEL